MGNIIGEKGAIGYIGKDITHNFTIADSQADIQAILDSYAGNNIGGELTFIFAPGTYGMSGFLNLNMATVGAGKIVFKGLVENTLYGKSFANGINSTLSLSGNVLSASGADFSGLAEQEIIIISDEGTSTLSVHNTTVVSSTATSLTLADVTGLIPANITLEGCAFCINPVKIANLNIPTAINLELRHIGTGISTEKKVTIDAENCSLYMVYTWDKAKVTLKTCCIQGMFFFSYSVLAFDALCFFKAMVLFYQTQGNIDSMYNFETKWYCIYNTIFDIQTFVSFLKSVFTPAFSIERGSFVYLYNSVSAKKIKNMGISGTGTAVSASKDSFFELDTNIENFDIGLYASDLGKIMDKGCTFVSCNTDYSPSPKGTRGNNEGIII